MKYLTFEVECLCLMPNNVGAYNMAIASTVLKIPLVIYGSVELAISLYFPKTFNFSNFDSTDASSGSSQGWYFLRERMMCISSLNKSRRQFIFSFVFSGYLSSVFQLLWREAHHLCMAVTKGWWAQEDL